jgi:hypothetical protein
MLSFWKVLLFTHVYFVLFEYPDFHCSVFLTSVGLVILTHVAWKHRTTADGLLLFVLYFAISLLVGHSLRLVVPFSWT